MSDGIGGYSACDAKPSNPKDIIGTDKLDLGVVPDSAIVGMAHALTEGAVKYGRYNWRVAGVRASIYHAATRRHLAKYWNGQDEDPATTVLHIDNAMASLAIMRDAMVYGMLTDDRPPCPSQNAMAELVDAGAAKVGWLRQIFANHRPKQYTIADTRDA